MELTIRLHPEDALPLYEQLYRAITAEIAAGRIPVGARLPSRRALCRHLGISGSTADAAYALLVQEGYVSAQEKRGYFVRPLQPLTPVKPAKRPDGPPASAAPPEFDFSTSAVDAGLFPYATWIRLFRDTLQSRPELLQRGDPQGDWELRAALCDFLYQRRGARISPCQLVIGAGADYLTGLLLQLLPKGTVVAAEDPGYNGIYRAGDRLGLPVLPIPLDEEGMSVDALARSGASVCHITPSHQFPLGMSMPIGRRSQLLHWAQEQEGRYIIEDDYDSEFRHRLRPLPALQGLSEQDRVIYLGTFSRSLAPSMRLAYMALPEPLLQQYHRDHHKSGETVSRFEQQTLAAFIAGGYLQRHLRRAGNAYAQRSERLLELLYAVPGARAQGTEAGLHFLLTIPQWSEADLVGRASKAGIALHGVSAYCRNAKAPPSTLVMGYAGLRDDQLEAAVDTLRRAWNV